MRSRIIALRLLGLCLLSAGLAAVDVGQAYPSLIGVTWITPPAQRQAHVTLVTLWTPDDPVYRSIMPRLSDLQRRHPEAAVIGLSAADISRVQPVLEAMRGRVSYANGLLPSLDPYLPPAGLPCSILIDQHGTVLWWGYPMDAAAPLADALEGTLHVELGAIPQPESKPSPPSDPTDDNPVPTAPIPISPPLLSRSPATVGVMVQPPTRVVVVEPHHAWWSWGFWPLITPPCYLPCPPVIVAPPLLPPLWRFGHIR